MARNDARSTSTSRHESSRGGSQRGTSGGGREQSSGREQSRRGESDVATRGREERGIGLWPGEYWTPQIETFRRGDEFVVRADLPGLKPEDVTVEASDDTLAIRGERRHEHEERGEGFYRTERSYGSFHRRIGLPEGVHADDIQAQFKDGVLEVTMPAGREPEQRERGRRIDVKGS